jgi:DNA-binding NarL/FixJ family response regulator
MIRIALVDDQVIVRAGLARILSPEEGFEVVAECTDGREAAEELPALRPDVVLMDMCLPALEGIAATERLRAGEDPPAVLALTTFAEEEVLWRAIEAGAAGFVLKDSSAQALIAAVRAVARGGAWFDPAVAPRLLERCRRVVVPAARDAARVELLTASTTSCASWRAGARTQRSPRGFTWPRRPSRPTSGGSSPSSRRATARRPSFSPSTTA